MINLQCADCGVKLPGPYGTVGVSMARTRPNVLLCSNCGTAEVFAPSYQKFSDWLSRRDSHSIYHFAELSADFKQMTGQDWPAYIETQTVTDAKAALGLGGYVSDGDHVLTVTGWVMARDFARHLVDFHSDKMGRKRIFDECVAAIAKAGL